MVKHTRDVAVISGLVYFTQGALGIAGIALPLYLRGLQWSVSDITIIMSAAASPWVFKIFCGLLSDTLPLLGYRRKSYLVLYSLVAAAGWLLLVILPAEKRWVMVCLFMTNLGFAATDVITDGLIVEHSTSLTSSIYQSIAWGSRSVGAIFSGFLGGWLAAHWPPKDVFLLTMLLPLSVTALVTWLREKKIKKGPFESPMTPVLRCLKLVLGSNLKWFTAILLISSISSTFGIPFFFFMKESLGFRETFLGLLSSLGWSGALLGSFIYMRWIRKIPIKDTLRWAIVVNSLNILSTLLIWDHRTAFLLVFVGGVMMYLTVLPIMSSAATLTHHTGVEGTLFALLMSIYNFGQIFFGFLGGKVFARIGLYPLIWITGIAGLGGLFFV